MATPKRIKNPPNPDDPRFISAVSDVAERISRRLINDEDKLLKFGLPLVHQNDHTQLTDIQQDQRDSVKDKYRRVLQLWARRKQSRWEDVIEQLQEIGLSQLADDLTKELEISQPSPPVPVDYGSRSKPDEAEHYTSVPKKPAVGGKSIKEIYDGFNLNLIQMLPMKDATFIARLQQAGLFGNGDLKSQVATEGTSQDAATYFLNQAISPCIPNNDNDVDLDPLYKLLKVMEEHGGPAKTLAKLAEKIRKAIPYTKGETAKSKKEPEKPEKQPDIDEISPPPVSSIDESDDKNKMTDRKQRKQDEDTPVPKKPAEGHDDHEKVHSTTDGTVYVPVNIRRKKEKAFCIVYTPGSKGTGVIGKIKISGQDSIVLLTNYHVMTPEKYKQTKPADISFSIKKEIEERAEKSKIEVDGKEIWLSDGMLVKKSSIISPIKSLDYFIMKFNDTKLRNEWPEISPLDLNHPTVVEKDDQIQISILQHPGGGPLSISQSTCRIVESRDRNKAKLLVYCGGTDRGSSGGLVFKAVNNNLEVVGLHRGGIEAKDIDEQNAKGYNFGSYFVEIIESIKKSWHPLALSRGNKDDKEDIDREVGRLS